MSKYRNTRVGAHIALAACAVVGLGASAAQDGQPPQIEFVVLGGNDCPPCVVWQAVELPKLKALPEYQMVRYTHVTKAIQSSVPSAFFFPSEIRQLQPALREASNGFHGSPQQAIVVNGKVVDYWWGSGKSDAKELAAMFRAIHEGKPLPRTVCSHLGPTREACMEGAQTAAGAK